MPDYESVGWGFEPLMAHHEIKTLKTLYFTVIQGFFFALNKIRLYEKHRYIINYNIFTFGIKKRVARAPTLKGQGTTLKN